MALFVLAALPSPLATAQSSYSEKLNVYVAGPDALWYMTLTGINGSNRLTGLESTPGLSWYNVTAVKTTGWQPDFLVFGASGYNLLPMGSLPPEGMFLTVGSDSYADAAAAASALDGYLLTAFVSNSNGTGTYSFYSPVSFDTVVPATLLRFLPSGEGGFANAIAPTSFGATASPMVILEGQKSASGFSHTLILGSISPAALDSSSRPNILGYFGSTQTSVRASSNSVSSTINVRFLDGLINASTADHANVTTDSTAFSSSYSIGLAAGKAVKTLNATVVERPVPLLATRTVSVGVLHTGDNLSVTLTLSDLSNSLGITKVSLNDTWWKAQGSFKFLGGNYTTPSGGIPPGGTVTPVYRLQYNGTAAGSVVIPATVVRYEYRVGASTFTSDAVLNPIRLSLSSDDAVVYAYVTPTGGFGKSVGASQELNITVVNAGTLAASSVVVAGKSLSGLAAFGGRATVQVTQSASTLVGVNSTRPYEVTYQDPNGANLNATTNVVSDIFSHQGMKVALVSIQSSAQVTFLAGGVTNLTLTLAVTSVGSVNATSLSARATMPSSFGCGAPSGAGIACSSGELTLSYSSLGPSTKHAYLKYNLTAPSNFMLGPLSFQYNTSGYLLSGVSNPLSVPTSISLSKAFTPSQLFGGMASEVRLSAGNSGPFNLYNLSITSSTDSTFDTVSGTGSSAKSIGSLPPGGNLSTSYGVIVSQTSGNFTSAPVTARLFFGGISYALSADGPRVNVYPPLRASITTSPTDPIEGKSFTIEVAVTNPSGVQVSNVEFTLPVPSGLSLSGIENAQLANGVLTMSAAELGPHQTINASGVAVAGSGILVPFDKGTLTFSYNGFTINGRLPSNGIAIGENVTTRYLIPIALVLLALLGTAYYVRRLAAPSAPASQN